MPARGNAKLETASELAMASERASGPACQRASVPVHHEP
jgi:hypothetical protein